MLSFLLAFEEGAEVAEEAAANPILPTVPELFWGALSFAALYALVKFVLLPPVKRVMEERANRIREDLDFVDSAQLRAGTAASAAADQLSGVRAEAASIVDAARSEAEAERAQILAKAEAEVAALKASSDAEIAAARAEAMSGIRPQVAELATAAASRVMNRQIDLGSAAPVVDRFLDNPN
ncbi:MAG: F0F1 ATP synthase subunit B [Acidimicrobiales bacterium]